VAGVGAPWPAIGSLPERGKWWKEEGRGGTVGGGGMERGRHGGCRREARTMGSSARWTFCVVYVRKGKKEEGESRRKRKGWKRKEKMEKIQT
jgi:hypothetical protein